MKLTVLSIIFSACITHATPKYVPGVVSLEYRSAVRLVVTCLNGGMVSGSGVAINPKYVITAKHVVCGGHPPLFVVAVMHDMSHVTMTLDKVMDGDDTGSDVVRLVAVGIEPFKAWSMVAFERPDVGEPVCSVGGDIDVFLLRKCGEVLPLGVTDVLLTSIAGVPGNSGSGVYNRDGALVGILVRAKWETDAERVSILVPVANFRNALLGDIYL